MDQGLPGLAYRRRQGQFFHVFRPFIVDVIDGLPAVALALTEDAGRVDVRQEACQGHELPAGDDGDDADVLEFDGPAIEADQIVQDFIGSAAGHEEDHFDEDLRIDIAVPGQLAEALVAAAVVFRQRVDAVFFKDVKGHLGQRRQGAVTHLALSAAAGQDMEDAGLPGQDRDDELFGTGLADGEDDAFIGPRRFAAIVAATIHESYLLHPRCLPQGQPLPAGVRLSGGRCGSAAFPGL